MIVEVNVKGLTTMAQEAFPLLKRTPGSALVNLCSASSVHGIPLLTVEGKRAGYLLGTSARLWGMIDKFLPESGRRRLVRYLSNH